MSRKKHSTKALANLLASILTPLLGRGWGRLLLTALMLLAGRSYVHAQNDADNPYTNSWHRYTVDMGDTGNTPSWELIGGASGPHTLSHGLMQAGEQWVAIETIGSTINIDIKFIDALFVDGEIWSLIYSETTPLPDGQCIARREKAPITIFDNTFYLDMAVPGLECNSYSAYVWDNSDGLLSAATRVDTVDFEVTMHKAANFDITTWYFDGKLTLFGGHQFNPLSVFVTPYVNTLIQADDWDITNIVVDISNTITTFTLTVDVDDSNFLADTLGFRVLVQGDITDDFDIQLELGDGGTATSGSTYTTLTDDNLSGIRDITKTIWGVPNTSLITVVP